MTLDKELGMALPRGEKLTVAMAIEVGLHKQGVLVAKIAADATQGTRGCEAHTGRVWHTPTRCT